MKKGEYTIWSKEKVIFLQKWFPHIGAWGCARELSLTQKQVSTKADKMKIHLLPKKQRLCRTCKNDYQYSRAGGWNCRKCHLKHRKELRARYVMPLSTWIAELTNTARYRSKVKSDLTTEYMVALWEKQHGLCHYSNIPMTPPKYGAGRNPYSASIDKLVPEKGYVKGNVVWALWVCNAGKNDMSIAEYITICTAVTIHSNSF